MGEKMSVRKAVCCSECGASIVRVVWNYGKNRPMENFFCNNECKGAWQVKQREALGFNKEWLQDQYITQGKDANQIALEIGRDGKSVWTWLKNYGIPTRKRGEDKRQHFKKGHKMNEGRKLSDEHREAIRQARIKDGRVPYLKDGKHWLHHEGAKPWTWRGGITPERQAFYSSDEWKDAVKAVWSRDKATCQRCSKHHNTAESRGTFHIHHIISFMNKELRAEPSNLVLLCRSCHLWVHSSANTEKQFIKAR